MSLIESARGFVKGLVPSGPEVGEHDQASAESFDAEEPVERAAAEFDETERMRREWDTQPSHH